MGVSALVRPQITVIANLEANAVSLESMGVEHLRARTNPGFEIKIHSSLLVLYFTNAN